MKAPYKIGDKVVLVEDVGPNLPVGTVCTISSEWIGWERTGVRLSGPGREFNAMYRRFEPYVDKEKTVKDLTDQELADDLREYMQKAREAFKELVVDRGFSVVGVGMGGDGQIRIQKIVKTEIVL